MHLFFVEELKDIVELDEEESRHFRVLRINDKDEIIVSDGLGRYAKSQIIEVRKKTIKLKLLSIHEEKNKTPNLTLVVAPTKSNERTEWLLEKAVEIGVGKIVFVNTKNTERNKINLERFSRIVKSAAKQSLTFTLPKVEGFYMFPNLIKKYSDAENKFIALCKSETSINEVLKKINRNNEIIFIVGPEGGFTNDEKKLAIDNGFKSVMLTNKRLRTETACIFIAVSVQMSGLFSDS